MIYNTYAMIRLLYWSCHGAHSPDLQENDEWWTEEKNLCRNHMWGLAWGGRQRKVHTALLKNFWFWLRWVMQPQFRSDVTKVCNIFTWNYWEIFNSKICCIKTWSKICRKKWKCPFFPTWCEVLIQQFSFFLKFEVWHDGNVIYLHWGKKNPTNHIFTLIL